jgi:predicted HicB family RNase H-like nuclease
MTTTPSLDELRRRCKSIKSNRRSKQPRMVTVRMTAELHERIAAIARREQVSINMLCLNAIEDQVNYLESVKGT